MAKKTTKPRKPVATAGSVFPHELMFHAYMDDDNIDWAYPVERDAGTQRAINFEGVLRDAKGRIIIAVYKLSHFEAIEPENAVVPDAELYAEGQR